MNAYGQRCQNTVAGDLRAHVEMLCQGIAESYEDHAMRRPDGTGNENVNACVQRCYDHAARDVRAHAEIIWEGIAVPYENHTTRVPKL